jgi:pyruvate decarboxylase
MASEKVPAERLKNPLSRTPPKNDPEVEGVVLDEIIKAIGEAESNIIILVDACVIRHDAQDEVKDLVTATRFPVFSSPMGKTAVSEEYDRYGGVCLRCLFRSPADLWSSKIYIGSVSEPRIKEMVERAKLILSIGALKSDFNTGMFTYRIPTARTIEV